MRIYPSCPIFVARDRVAAEKGAKAVDR